MFTTIITLILGFSCFDAYVYGESHFVCKQMDEVFSSHTGESRQPSPIYKTGKKGIKGDKGEKGVAGKDAIVDYIRINTTMKEFVIEQIQSNSILLEKFENLTTMVDRLRVNNTALSEEIDNLNNYKTELREEIDGLKGKTTKLQKNNSKLSKKIDNLNKIKTDLEKNIDLQTTNNTDRTERIAILEAILSRRGKVRLVNGGSLKKGRVEVLYNGTWGTVCDDNWNDGNGKSGKNNADVVCRQLGFSNSTWYSIIDGTNVRRYGNGEGQIWLDDVRCTGSENFISDCLHRAWGEENCSNGEDVAVECE